MRNEAGTKAALGCTRRLGDVPGVEAIETGNVVGKHEPRQLGQRGIRHLPNPEGVPLTAVRAK